MSSTWVALLGFASAACGLVAVAAMIQQRLAGGGVQQRLDKSIIIDGGNAAGVVEEETPHHLGAILRDMAANPRPGLIAIVFAGLGVIFAFAAAVVSLIGS
jgi:hypothetical protein